MNEYLFLAASITHPEMVETPVLDENGDPTYDPDTGEPITEMIEVQVSNYPYHMAVNTGMLGEQFVMEVLHTADPLLPGDTLIAWRVQGEDAAQIVDDELYKQIRPFGNSEEGYATGPLLYAHLDGFPERLFSTGDTFPPEEDPYVIEIRHKLFDNPAAPAADGWGYRAEILARKDGSSRDPSVRSIGAATDSSYADYLWPTTGGFIWGISDWQVDADDNPIETWYVESWDGYRPDVPETWYCALLYSSVLEGKAILDVNEDGVSYIFWEKNQEKPKEILPWVQPESTNPYQIGDLVSHNEQVWISIAADNVWEPGVYGWEVSTEFEVIKGKVKKVK